jgi:uncharacterized LabA/DUF88 family protein
LHVVGGGAELTNIYYFSALAAHLEAAKPDVTARHRTYIRGLESTGVTVQLSRFKEKEIRCPACGHRNVRHEEKETDVAIAAKLIEVFATDECDSAVLVTGDTDVAPAVRVAQRLYRNKRVYFAFPYRRKNKELAQLVPTCFQLSREAYVKHQLPDPVTLPDGTQVSKPAGW